MCPVDWRLSLTVVGFENICSGVVAPDSPKLPLVCLNDVVKTYETPGGPVAALRGISLSLDQGEFLLITGKSGAGKSTLVNMVTGVDYLTSGHVVVDGISVPDLSDDDLAQWRGRTIGIVYQTFELLPQISLLDNVMLPMDLCGLYRRGTSEARAMDLLRQVELEDHALKTPTRISGGQQQRVAIARALANDPPILVADQPTGNLDSVTAGAIMSLFEQLVAEGKTILMVTHDTSLMKHATRHVAIADGLITDAHP